MHTLIYSYRDDRIDFINSYLYLKFLFMPFCELFISGNFILINPVCDY